MMQKVRRGIYGFVSIGVLISTTLLHAKQGDVNMKNVRNRAGEEPEAIVAIKDVCAWPNLTLLSDGAIIAAIHNQPSHLRKPGDVDCWAGGDSGRSWEKRGTPAPRDNDKAARGHVAAGVTPGGDLIVITTGWSDPAAPGRGEITTTWISRSEDGGRTWQIDRDLFPKGPDDNPVVPFGDIMPGYDGHLRMAAYRSNRTFVYRSVDDGRTWGDAVVLSESPTSETALLHLGNGQWLAAARHDGLKLYVSEDDARTWHFLSVATGRNQHPGHLMRLKDGSILLSYGNRQDPRGVDVRFSDDEGKSWSEPFRVLGFQGDGGYPDSVQLPDGRVLTAYYAQRIQGVNRYHMGVVIWCPDTTRGATGAGVQPGTGEAP